MTPLRQRMSEDMEIRNLSENTQLSYLQQVSLFAKHFKRSPELLGPEEIRAYQVHATTERKLAPGTLCTIASSLRFLYKVTLKREWVDLEIPLPKKPFKLPVIPSREEVAHFLDSIASLKHRTILMTAYAAGLRIAYRRASEIEAKPIRWLWPNHIARGKVSMIAGNPGLGKSQVTISMASVVSNGSAWPADGTRCERGNVIFLSAEDDAEDTIRPRLEAAGADLSRVYIIGAVVECYQADGGEVVRAFNLKTDLTRLGALLAEIGDVGLVVIDPVSAYLGDTNSHNNAEIRALLSPLSDLAAKYGVAVVCVSHLNKSVGAEALMRVTGSTAFVAAARAAFLVLKDPENESRRLLLPLKNNLGNDQAGFAFSVQSARINTVVGPIDTSRVVWESGIVNVTADEALIPQDDPEERSELEDAKRFLSDLLAEGPVASKRIRADSQDVGYSWATIRRAQKALRIEVAKDGLKGGWEWRLGPKVLKKAEDAHIKSVSTFEKNEHLRQISESPSGIVELEI